ncbi:hypothetical protein HDU96_008575 [Phlyctochytrium bullatum]|nr:hypothetical protein HDU96_008575 [Phlyctochytrium bullatum]
MGKKLGGDEIEGIASMLKSDIRFQARPRFLAFVLDEIASGKSVTAALTALSVCLTDPKDHRFPIRNWKPERSLGRSTYHTVILETINSIILGRGARVNKDPISYDDAAALINIGVGYAKEVEGPDVIAKTPDGTYRFYQVKFTSGPEIQHAISTIDALYLYCVPKTEFQDPIPIKGYENHYEKCQSFFTGKAIERHLICQGKRDMSKYALEGVPVISEKPKAGFFSSLESSGKSWPFKVISPYRAE